MKSYWDLSNCERAELTREQVAALEPLELMRRGVARPVEPVPPQCEPEPRVNTTTMFQIYYGYHSLPIAFESAEAAQEFLETEPILLQRSCEGASKEFSVAGPLLDPQIRPVQVASRGNWEATRAAWEAWSRGREDAGRRAKHTHEQQARVTAALAPMWDDWSEVCDRRHEAAIVISTLKEYVRLTNGDVPVAMTFLAKAYSDDEIRNAHEFGLGKEIDRQTQGNP